MTGRAVGAIFVETEIWRWQLSCKESDKCDLSIIFFKYVKFTALKY